METKSKTHYRKVFKSDHLGTPDLEEFIEEGKELIFTVLEVKQERGTRVAGKKIDANIAYFKEPIKPLVLNATNSKTMKLLSGGSSFVEDWKGIRVQLYIDPSVKMKGEIVGGVRIMPKSPTMMPKKPEFTDANFKKAKEANATLETIKLRYSITSETEKKYTDYVAAN
jgi:hypothetical protein